MIPTGQLGFDWTYKNCKNVHENVDSAVICSLKKLQIKTTKTKYLSYNNTNNNNNDEQKEDNNDEQKEEDDEKVAYPRDFKSRLDIGMLEICTDRDFLVKLHLVPGLFLFYINFIYILYIFCKHLLLFCLFFIYILQNRKR